MEDFDVKSAIAAVERAFGVPAVELLSRDRTRRVSEPRFAAWRLLYNSGVRICDISRSFDRGQETVYVGIKKAASLVEIDRDFQEKYNAANVVFDELRSGKEANNG